MVGTARRRRAIEMLFAIEKDEPGMPEGFEELYAARPQKVTNLAAFRSWTRPGRGVEVPSWFEDSSGGALTAR